MKNKKPQTQKDLEAFVKGIQALQKKFPRILLSSDINGNPLAYAYDDKLMKHFKEYI